MDLDNIRLTEYVSEEVLPVSEMPWFDDANQYLVIPLKRKLKAGQIYSIDIQFSAPLGLEVGAFYRTSYESNMGTR